MRTRDDVSLHVASAGSSGSRLLLHDRGRSRGLRCAIDDGGARGEALEVADGGKRREHDQICERRVIQISNITLDFSCLNILRHATAM